MRYDAQQVEALGRKLDRLAEELTEEERYLLAAVFELAASSASSDRSLLLSDRLQRVLGVGTKGQIDVGPFHVIM
jgi:hypothetical protein